ncbi:response regulator transcription factor [Lentzea sp. DG1S-22]|uniref:helix-turn-helix transcriptional regulator n=1 Tax=Lentzea sp. DG1S-22 TaxID=3108822 RepID=UPI002E778F36|nr:response regulator transcription factor [Lentzea sp. DG1S-22]WVH82415.1 response regulator transcription factor [Lentzea sp. DG1S-22]
MGALRVAVQASDPLTAAGLISGLSAEQDVTVEEGLHSGDADVRVVAAGSLTPGLLLVLRRAAAKDRVPVVLVVTRLREAELLAAVECGVVAVLPRASVTPDRLVHSVRAAAAGGGVLPPAMIGELLKHVERLQHEVLAPKGMNASGLSPREVEVLRMMAEGLDTAEIAGKLCYSERTVKNVIAGFTQRLNLRNRPHAVAYAMRAGMI